MAASASGAGDSKVSMEAKAKALVDAKIKEGVDKVQLVEEYAVRTDRAIDALEKKVQGIEAVVELELLLEEYCTDLSDMHKARHYYRATSLSDAEKLYLRQIDDFATATIADYEASGSPVPAFDNHLSLFSQDIPLEFPEPLAPPPPSSASASASHHEREPSWLLVNPPWKRVLRLSTQKMK